MVDVGPQGSRFKETGDSSESKEPGQMLRCFCDTVEPIKKKKKILDKEIEAFNTLRGAYFSGYPFAGQAPREL
jgi:hypothetical protein